MLARPLLVFAAIGVVPLLAYGVDQALMQRNTFPPSADPHHQAHWFAMATFAFVVVLAVATAAAGAAGWRLAAIVASVATIVVAAVSVAMPDAASSLGRTGGVAALLWAAGVLVVTARSRRRAARRPHMSRGPCELPTDVGVAPATAFRGHSAPARPVRAERRLRVLLPDSNSNTSCVRNPGAVLRLSPA